MASIHKRPGSKCWHCSFRDEHGRQIFRSTKQTDRFLAQNVCLSFEAAVRLVKQKRATQAQIKRVISAVMETVGTKPITYTIRQWLNSWVGNKQSSRAPATGVRYRGVAKEFLNFLKGRADDDLESLSIDDIRRFRDSLLKAGASPVSANLNHKTLRAALNAAVAQGHLTYNPANGVDLLPKNRPIRDQFTHAQIAAILEVADPEWKVLIKIGYYVGARLGTYAKLRLKDVNFEACTITFIPEKQQRSRDPQSLTVPLHPELVEILRSPRRSGGGCERLPPQLSCQQSNRAPQQLCAWPSSVAHRQRRVRSS
jgi:integrase